MIIVVAALPPTQWRTWRAQQKLSHSCVLNLLSSLQRFCELYQPGCRWPSSRPQQHQSLLPHPSYCNSTSEQMLSRQWCSGGFQPFQLVWCWGPWAGHAPSTAQLLFKVHLWAWPPSSRTRRLFFFPLQKCFGRIVWCGWTCQCWRSSGWLPVSHGPEIVVQNS